MRNEILINILFGYYPSIMTEKYSNRESNPKMQSSQSKPRSNFRYFVQYLKFCIKANDYYPLGVKM